MGYAAYRAWTIGIDSYDPRIVDMTLSGATFYTLQLAFNFAWTPLFFGAKRPVEALIDSVALTGTAWYTTYLWFHVDKAAGYTLLPYCAWLGFATYLCVSDTPGLENVPNM